MYNQSMLKADSLKGKVRLKAQIHDSILFCYNDEDSPKIIQEMMRHSVVIPDIHKVSRTLLIPSDINYGGTSWGSLK